MISAIIPTIPERRDLLGEAVASVHLQTLPVDQLIIITDWEHEGPAAARNRGALESTSDWLAFLDDDDVWLPNHLETLAAHPFADVVYSDCEVVGDSGDLIVNRDFDRFALLRHNFIPVTALVKRRAFMDAGMFDTSARYEDWELWKAMSMRGSSFVHVPTVTWRYRFHDRGQRTFQES